MSAVIIIVRGKQASGKTRLIEDVLLKIPELANIDIIEEQTNEDTTN